MENRSVAERYAQALQTRDLNLTADMAHPDIVVRYPQSGEVIRGRDNYLAMLSNYPSGLPDAEVTDLHGGKAGVHVSSPFPFGMPTITVIGSGDTFIIEGVAEYPDGALFNIVVILTIADGRVSEEVSYFAAPFDAPEWRQPFLDA
jgi:hypothetical protein